MKALTRLSVTAVGITVIGLTSMAQAGWSLFPANGAKNIPVDTRLRIWFEEPPEVGVSGSLRVYDAADDELVEEIRMAPAPDLRSLRSGGVWPWQNTYGGEEYNYYPVITSGYEAEIELRSGRLQYGREYYVLMDEGFLQNEGFPIAAIRHKNTWRFSTKEKAPEITDRITVSPDGSGDFFTIQGAVDAVPENSRTRVTINLKRGTYREIVNIGRTKDMITIRGEGRDVTRIEYANNDLLNPGTAKRGMMRVRGDDFILEDITLHNLTPLGGSQAETIVVRADRTILRNCAFLSYQDTILLQGRVFVTNCLIEGSVDFIWGSGAAYFEKCEIRSSAPGYIVQARNDKATPGYIFVDCRLTARPGIKDIWLARTAGERHAYAQVAYINCAIGEHIRPLGWHVQKEVEATIRLQEYKSTDLAGNPLDVSGRHPASRQLS
ncbi:MAG TPA: pectinesterase family protein, partial [Sedimentisphaerales bacterium]|nr:pectinesterase family protein [Sedimentisphaerales bacterium]